MTESLATAVIDDRVVVYDLAQPIPVLSANLTIMEVAGKELCLHGDGIHVAVATEGRSIHIDYAQVILCLGSVLVFSVPSWKLKYKIDLADSQSCEEIFISNKVLLVGQQGRNGKSSADYVMIDLFVEMSTVNIYHLIDSDWFLSQTIRGSNVSDFGHSLAVSGALALIGAPNDGMYFKVNFFQCLVNALYQRKFTVINSMVTHGSTTARLRPLKALAYSVDSMPCMET